MEEQAGGIDLDETQPELAYEKEIDGGIDFLKIKMSHLFLF